MKTIFEMSDAEIMKLFNKAMNTETVEEKEARRRERIRESKIDFCNLSKSDTCEFVEA